jgi:hypothetical protein
VSGEQYEAYSTCCHGREEFGGISWRESVMTEQEIWLVLFAARARTK